jgi:hypothetical protein
VSLLKGTDWPPTSRSISLAQRGIRDGLRGASPIGHGVSVVVVGVTSGQGGRESRPHWAKGHRCLLIDKDGEVREMRDAATVLEIIPH